MSPATQAAVLRRSVARGIAAAALTALAATSALTAEPVELHVVGGSQDGAETTTEAAPEEPAR
jgi:hypothetical protein